MKKTLCLLLVLLLCAGTAWAEEGKNEKIDLTLRVGEQFIAGMMSNEASQELVSAVQSLLDNLTLRILNNDRTTRMEVYLKDRLLLDMTYEETAEYSYMTTSLLPGYVMAERMVSLEDEGELEAQLSAVLKKYVGEPKTSVFFVKEVSSVAFNTRLKVELDGKQLSDMLEEMIDILNDQMPVEEMEALSSQMLAGIEAESLYALAESDFLLKGDYYTRMNGDYLYLFRLFMGDTALDILWSKEDGYTTIVLVPCFAPHASRIPLNIEKALEADELEGVLISMYEYEQGVEGMLVSPFAMAQFSHETIQEKEYGTLSLEMGEGMGPLGMGMSYEIGEDAVVVDVKVLTGDYQEPALTMHMEGSLVEEGPAPIDMAGNTLVYIEQLDEDVLLEMEQDIAMSMMQLLIDACAAMPDEMAAITTACMGRMNDMGSAYGIIGGADGPTSIYLGEEYDLYSLEEYQRMIDELGWDLRAEDMTDDELNELLEAYMDMVCNELEADGKGVSKSEEGKETEQPEETPEPKPTARPLFGPR